MPMLTRDQLIRGHVNYVITKRPWKRLLSVDLVYLALIFPKTWLQNHDCLLCPRAGNEERTITPWPSPDTFLRACKPTEGQGWTHVLCAVFTPEITFTDASRLRLVEGLNTVTRHKWSAVSFCTLLS